MPQNPELFHDRQNSTATPHSGDIMLVSESNDPNHKPIYVSSEDDFMINGKIIAVIKK